MGPFGHLSAATNNSTGAQDVARRVALAMRHALLHDETVVYEGPVPISAIGSPSSSSVSVHFHTQAGSGGIDLNTSVACPEVRLCSLIKPILYLYPIPNPMRVAGDPRCVLPPVAVSRLRGGGCGRDLGCTGGG